MGHILKCIVKYVHELKKTTVTINADILLPHKKKGKATPAAGKGKLKSIKVDMYCNWAIYVGGKRLSSPTSPQQQKILRMKWSNVAR